MYIQNRNYHVALLLLQHILAEISEVGVPLVFHSITYIIEQDLGKLRKALTYFLANNLHTEVKYLLSHIIKSEVIDLQCGFISIIYTSTN